MTQKNLRRTMTAALLTLVATAAYGQENALVAKIPFGFRANGSELPAGRYRIARQNGSLGAATTMELRNLDNGKAIFLPSMVPMTERPSNGKDARLIFHCAGDDGCALETLWSGTGTGMEFSMPPMTASQRERHETIYMDPFKGK
jgi:hypothetical protein